MQRGPLLGDGHLVLFGDGDAVTVTAEDDPVRFLLSRASRSGEPIAWYGPIVMNTQEELRVAFDELETARSSRPARSPADRRPSGRSARPPQTGSTSAWDARLQPPGPSWRRAGTLAG